MSITLIKNQTLQHNSHMNAPHLNPLSQVQGGDVDAFRDLAANQILDCYCDVKSRMDLLRQATDNCGIPADKAAIILDVELENKGCVNEKKMLDELEAVLKQFTNKDKKLDPKEHEDAMQIVCKARPGYSKGLSYDVAERYIVNFCRTNSVKVKTGLFKWAIP